MAGHLRQWLDGFGAQAGDESALAALARLGGGTVQGKAVHLPQGELLHALLTAPAGTMPTHEQCGWLAWLLWQGGRAQVSAETSGWCVTLADAPVLPTDWMADAMERLGRP